MLFWRRRCDHWPDLYDILSGWHLENRHARDRQRLRRQEADEFAMKPLSLREQLRLVLANKPFVLVCGIYLCSWLAMQFTATVLPFYTQSWLRLPATTFQLLALTVQTTALCLMPVWGWVSVRIGKKPVYFIGMSLWLLAQGGLMYLQPGDTRIIFLMAFVAGFGISVCYLIPNAMLPDVIEYDELKTGRRREGIYYGFCVFLQKTRWSALCCRPIAACRLYSADLMRYPSNPESGPAFIRGNRRCRLWPHHRTILTRLSP
jgi:Na+/melibiose symporter-like transporter